MIEITTLTISDWHAYRDLRLKALKECPLAFLDTFQEALNRVADHWKGHLQTDDSITLFARDNDKLVGMVAAVFNQKNRTAHRAEIVGNYVLEGHRGKGIGKQMLTVIIEKIKEKKDMRKINLSVADTQTAAIKLYEKFGFRIVGESIDELYFDDKYYNLVLMEKLLNEK